MSDEESTQEIDIKALRDSLAAAAEVDGTVPAHDVAQALRAMMEEMPDLAERAREAFGEVAPFSRRFSSVDSQEAPIEHDELDELEDGDTQTRLPDGPLPVSTLDVVPESIVELQGLMGDPPPPASDEALPAFSLDEDEPEPWRSAWEVPTDVTDERSAITRAVDPAALEEIAVREEERVRRESVIPATTRQVEAVASSGALPRDDEDDSPPHETQRIEAVPLDTASDFPAETVALPAAVVAREPYEPDEPHEPPLSEEAEIVELLPEEILDDDEAVEDEQTQAGAPVAAPPPAAPSAPADVEEAELFAQGRYGELVALLRERLAATEGPNRRAAILLRIADAYESGQGDLDQALDVTFEAFEVAPANEDVVAALDRRGHATSRLPELADRVKKKLLPRANDERRVVWLGHLVYWYERVLGRGAEVSPLVSEIERLDKVHPLVLKRAAQIAAMNGDVKVQREHLLRALERTTRAAEKAGLHLLLADAFAGAPDEATHLETALALDPSSSAALRGLLRLGKEKEEYGRVVWALERRAEVAKTDAERIEALLELAELQESKFLKREVAAELLERVLAIEPSHAGALRALERCYHALRDWPRLARILTVRAENAPDKKTRIELLELAAEVHESKLGDPDGAIDVHRALLAVDPKHRRALGDLARLYEKQGDWASVATYKARLAELASSKRASSQELVKLGDFLNVPERDPIGAKLQYERAVAVDPTNALGWEALQKIAAADGDDRRVIECLAQRKEHTEIPRQRAMILVELAEAHRRAGDREAAHACFEEAVQDDPSNEPAAIEMLDAFTAEERWHDAAPLCELLVNAAIRDRDTEALFVRLRLATRIAAALGDADRAVTSAMAACDARPDDPAARADLIAVCSQSPPAAKRAEEHLARIAEDPDAVAPDLLLRLAIMRRDAGDLDRAAPLYERARRADPENQDILRDLAEVYLAQGDLPHACKLKVDLARGGAATADQKFELFVEAGEIWARRADELEKAASVFEEARALKPLDPWLLQTLRWLYGELGDWAMLAGVLEQMAETQDDVVERAGTLLSLAELARDRQGDEARALELCEQVLDLDPSRLAVFEEIVRARTEAKDWEALEAAYRRMIARLKDDAGELAFLLHHQIGLVYRDRLGDAERAIQALDTASRLRPDDAEVRKSVIELLVVTDDLDNAVLRVRRAIDHDPLEPKLYAELYELFLRQHYFDKAWCVVNVLARLGSPTPEQQRFHQDYAPMPLAQVPGQIVEQAWRSHVFHADLDPALTRLYGLMTPAVARLRFSQLRPDLRVGRPFTPNHSTLYDSIRTTFDNASEILATTSPDLLLGDPGAPNAFTPALAPFGAILIATPALEEHVGSLVYLVGKRLAEQRPELAARAFFPAASDLASLLGTATRMARNEPAKDAATAALDASFAAILSAEERDGIRSIVLQAQSEGVTLDVQRWSQAADLSSMRAGLLLCGDVLPVRDAILAESTSPTELSAEQKVGELYKFASSDLYSDLRGAIGVAVQE